MEVFMKAFAITLAVAIVSWTVTAPVASSQDMPAQSFAEKAAQSDIFEMEAARLVLEKGASDAVKTFAGDMVKDHGKSTHGLHEAATKDGVKLPADMGSELMKKLEALKPLAGPALDAAYISTQVSVHTNAVELFDRYSKDGQAGALKAFAQQTHPTIRMHLVRVRNFNVEK
jgi:putative membrane protein